jgi:hypothetical protein
MIFAAPTCTQFLTNEVWIDMTHNLIQAYRQTPWRGQLRWVGLFLLALVVVALIAGMYLNITAQTVAAGVLIQELNNERTQLMLNISNEETALADIKSTDQMQKRADELGFQRSDLHGALYLQISSYSGRQGVHLGEAYTSTTLPRQLIKPSYTQSLWEWIFVTMADLTGPTGVKKP